MQMILIFARSFVLSTGITIVVFTLLFLLAKAIYAAEPTQRVQEATRGQQDRTGRVDEDEYEGYDNSDFLRDMDQIARGTYIDGKREGSGEAEGE